MDWIELALIDWIGLAWIRLDWIAWDGSDWNGWLDLIVLMVITTKIIGLRE